MSNCRLSVHPLKKRVLVLLVVVWLVDRGKTKSKCSLKTEV